MWSEATYQRAEGLLPCWELRWSRMCHCWILVICHSYTVHGHLEACFGHTALRTFYVSAVISVGSLRAKMVLLVVIRGASVQSRLFRRKCHVRFQSGSKLSQWFTMASSSLHETARVVNCSQRRRASIQHSERCLKLVSSDLPYSTNGRSIKSHKFLYCPHTTVHSFYPPPGQPSSALNPRRMRYGSSNGTALSLNLPLDRLFRHHSACSIT